jgi:gamma-glutamyl-gamma-aminobutyrate hydrolase PuuD
VRSTKILVNSLHGQAIDVPAPGLVGWHGWLA